MSDGNGASPDGSIDSEEVVAPDESVIPPADAVIPPPPPELPVPDGLLAPPPPVIPSPEAVIPPPPPEARLRSDRVRPTPALLDGEPPAAAAADWAQPSVAPQAPTSGGYRVLTALIFTFLLVLLVGAIGVAVFLLNTSGFPFVSASDDALALGRFAFSSTL